MLPAAQETYSGVLSPEMDTVNLDFNRIDRAIVPRQPGLNHPALIRPGQK